MDGAWLGPAAPMTVGMKLFLSGLRVVLMALLFALAMAPAAAAPRFPESPAFRILTVKDGLPSTSVTQIAEDRQGYLWIGTTDGLARYDGVGFTRYGQQDAPLLAGHVMALHAGNDGRLWIGTSQGLLLHHDGRFIEVPVTSGPDQAQGAFAVRAIIGDGKDVLVAGPDGVYASDGTRLSLRHPLDGPALSLLRRADGVWVGSTGQVVRIDNVTFDWQ